jgi:hypothetical protein
MFKHLRDRYTLAHEPCYASVVNPEHPELTLLDADYEVQRHHGISVNHGDQRRNYSGDEADIHPIMVTCGGTTAAMMQRIFTQLW